MRAVEAGGGRSTPHCRAGRHAPRKTARQAMDGDTTGAHRTLGGDGGADSPRNVGTLNPTDVLVPTRPCRRVAGAQQMPRGRHRGGYTACNRHCDDTSASPTTAAATAATHTASTNTPSSSSHSPSTTTSSTAAVAYSHQAHHLHRHHRHHSTGRRKRQQQPRRQQRGCWRRR